MQMVQGESLVDCYFFWRWQYLKRQKQSGIMLYLNPYEQQYRENIKNFERNNNIDITPDRIMEAIASCEFVYYYPDCMSCESITTLDSSYLNNKGDEIIDYEEDGRPIYSGFNDYIENDCYLVAIDKKASIDIVLADIKYLFEKDSKSREKAFIKSRGKKFSGNWKKDKQRAIGLWLYDYGFEHNCGGQTAISALRKTKYLDDLGLTKDKENDRSLERWLAGTKACVEAAEVLPLTC